MEKLIKCSVCGDEINISSNYCPSCGSSTKIKNKKKSEEQNNSNRNINHNKKTIDKKLNSTKLFYIIFSLLLFSLLVLFASGIFESSSLPTSDDASIDQFHSGVDLSKLQQINSLEEEIKKVPNLSKLLELAHLLNDSGFKEKAIERYKEYLKSDSTNTDVLVDMGVCYYELGKNDEALKWMKEGLKYQPKHQIAHLNLGIVSMSSGKKDDAKNWWQKAIEINPNNEIGKRAEELIKQL